MGYTKIDLFGNQKSKGTFDDFFDTEKYMTMQEAYAANDYVECDFVKDDDGILYIEARHVQFPEIRKYHELNWQRPVAGLDVLDDSLGCELACSMFTKS